LIRVGTAILWAGLLVVAGLCLIGCERRSPTAPETVTQPTPMENIPLAQPLHHNIPATMDTGEGLDIVVWVCETQPRIYIEPDGRQVSERDHYISRDRCPEVPIN
jgi:hypothetical protein